MAAAHTGSHARRILAVEKLGQALTKLSADAGLHQVSGSELDTQGGRDIANNAHILSLANNNPTLAVNKHLSQILPAVEMERVFLGETVWEATIIYRAAWLRPLKLIYEAKNRRSILPWREDEEFRSLLAKALPPDTLAELFNRKDTRVIDPVVAMEQHLMRLLDDLLTGKASASVGLSQAIQVAQIARSHPLDSPA